MTQADERAWWIRLFADGCCVVAGAGNGLLVSSKVEGVHSLVADSLYVRVARPGSPDRCYERVGSDVTTWVRSWHTSSVQSISDSHCDLHCGLQSRVLWVGTGFGESGVEDRFGLLDHLCRKSPARGHSVS